MPNNPILITDSGLSGLLKNIYEMFRVQLFPRLTPALAQLKKARPGGPERMQWGGNGVFWDVVVDRPVGMTASDAGFFPPSAHATERQANLGVRRTYVTREVDMLAIQGTQSKEAAYLSLARKILTEATDAATLGQQEIVHGDGRAIKGIIGTVTDTTHIVVASPYGIASSGRAGLLLDKGMYIAVLDTTGATLRGKATITVAANSGDNVTLTLDTAIVGMVATDIVVPATSSDTAFNQYPNGFTNILNRGAAYNSLHGLSAATNARWDALRLVAGIDVGDANAISEMDLVDLAMRAANRSGKNPMTSPNEFLCITTPGLFKKLGESFLGQRQWQMQDRVTLKGGFEAVKIVGLNVIQDYWCPSGTVYLLHLPSLTWVDRQDWVKLSYEGSGPWRWIEGRDAHQINLGAYWNLGTLQRNAHGMITGYTDSIRYDHVM